MDRTPVKARKDQVHVVHPDPPVKKEILAEAIVRIGESMEKLRKSGMNRKAIVALVKDDTGISKAQIETVLDSLELLRRNCT